MRGKREVPGIKPRSTFGRPPSGRRPPIFQQKVEQMYKDEEEEESSDEGEGIYFLYFSSDYSDQSFRLIDKLTGI